MSSVHLFVFVGGIAFLLGLRGSVRLTHRYADVSHLLVPRERLLLASLVTTCWLITLTGGIFVGLTARRLFGYAPFEWGPIVTIVLASMILFIPAGLDYVVDRVARVPWR